MNTAGLMIAGFGVWLGSPEFDPKGKIRLSVEGAVIVAKVVEMDDTNATNRNPPRVALEVSEVLHGKHMGRYLNAEWGPPEPPYTILCGNDAYYDRPLPGPPLGIDMILVVQPTHWGTPRISGPRYSATPKRRTEARARIETLKKRWASKEVRKRRWDANKSDRRKKKQSAMDRAHERPAVEADDAIKRPHTLSPSCSSSVTLDAAPLQTPENPQGAKKATVAFACLPLLLWQKG